MDNNKEVNNNAQTVTLNGQQVTQGQLQEAMDSCKKGERIKEVAPNEYRKQERMYS